MRLKDVIYYIDKIYNRQNELGTQLSNLEYTALQQASYELKRMDEVEDSIKELRALIKEAERASYRNPTVGQVLFIMINKGFKWCEIWKADEYLVVHSKTKESRSHLIAAKKIEILQDMGISSSEAQKRVLMEGAQKVNKKTLSLLGAPIASGHVEGLSNRAELWDNIVYRIEFKGLFRKTLIVLIE